MYNIPAKTNASFCTQDDAGEQFSCLSEEQNDLKSGIMNCDEKARLINSLFSLINLNGPIRILAFNSRLLLFESIEVNAIAVFSLIRRYFFILNFLQFRHHPSQSWITLTQTRVRQRLFNFSPTHSGSCAKYTIKRDGKKLS